MGEVYRARDTRLNRDVALKILREDAALDADRLQRFVREAQSLAALNHPHIAQIYGLEEVPVAGSTEPNRVRAIVMELVEGEDLSARIARGPIPVDEAAEIAKQIAEALEAAHEQHVVHRDLKPANIKVRGDGTVKVLDFGLAKALDTSGQSGASPTITTPAMMTGAGVILGTAGYMSPEQARGKTVDKRADIWAFGAVLYEMLTGKPAFPGDTVTDVLAAIVSKEPDWSALPAGVPGSIRHLLTRCLEKDHRLRLRDIGEARVTLAFPEAPASAVAPAGNLPKPRETPLWPWAIAAVAVLAGSAGWALKPVPAAPLRKIELSLPGDGRMFTLSPDGRRIAYFARGRVWSTDLERLESRELAPAPLAQRSLLIWSPDSTFVGYNTADGKLWVVPASGGAARLVCTIPESRQLMGAAWRSDGAIVLAVWRGSLYAVPASGGEPRAMVTIDPAKEIDFHLPVVLPDGRVVVATHLAATPGGSVDGYVLETIDGGRRETVLGTGFFPIAYADAGYLLLLRFDANQGLWAVPYKGRGAIPVEHGFLVAPGTSFPSAARADTLLYSLAAAGPQLRELVWVDRTGRVIGQIGPARDLTGPALSPDGRQVAFSARVDDNLDIWVRDAQGAGESRVTFEAGDEARPTWFPSGRRVAYVESGGFGDLRLAARSIDGSANRRELVAGMTPAISRDGRYLVFHIDDRGSNHLRYATIDANGGLSAAAALFRSSPEPNASAPALSPDGRFIAYVERQPSGNSEVVVTRFPSGDGRWQISAGGGRAPVWAGNGELFFLAGSTEGAKQMMAAPMSSADTLRAAAPVKLFDVGEELDANYQVPNFDVARDGSRLVMVRRAAGSAGPASRWVLVQNWMQEFTSTRH
jgi:hypothetical protein